MSFQTSILSTMSFHSFAIPSDRFHSLWCEDFKRSSIHYVAGQREFLLLNGSTTDEVGTFDED